MNPPQQVTSRYVRNLLIKGLNNDFKVKEIVRLNTQVVNVVVGYYFNVSLTNNVYHTQVASGVTIEQAVHRCLEKHGVTFR